MYKNFISYETPWAGEGLPYVQPTFVIIDKDGKILTTTNGFKPLNELDSEINTIKVYNDYDDHEVIAVSSSLKEIELDGFKLNVKTEYRISVDIDGNIDYEDKYTLYMEEEDLEQSWTTTYLNGYVNFTGVSYVSKENALALALAERDKYCCERDTTVKIKV